MPVTSVRLTQMEVLSHVEADHVDMVNQVKIVVEKHSDGFVAYPLGLRGVIVGEGGSYEEALADVTSAVQFHIQSFGPDALEGDPPVLEAFVAELRIAV